MQVRRAFRALVMLAVLAMPAAAQPLGVHWQTDIEGAKTLARETNRLVLVHFWTPNCGPCMTLESNVFNQPGFGPALESRFVPVKLNANENSATAMGFDITRVPTDVIITPSGELVGKLISPPTPTEYLAEVGELANQYAARMGRTLPTSSAVGATAGATTYVNSAYANLPLAPSTPAVAPPVPENPFAASRAPTFGSMVAGPGASAAPAMRPELQTSVAQVNPAVPDREMLPGSATAPGSPIIQGDSVPPTSATPTFTPQQVHAPTFPTPPPLASPSALVGSRYAAPPVASAPVTAPATTSVAASQPSAASVPAASTATASTPTPSTPAATTPTASTPSQFSNPYVATPGQPPATSAARVATVPSATAQVSAVESGKTSKDSAKTLAAPDASKLPPGSPPLGFDGYCPVSMRNQWKWVPGDPRFGIVHRGRTYWFAGQGEQQQFWANPDHYSPALAGIDPVLAMDHRQQVPGRREHSLDYDNLFYMFSSEATLQQFAANPERYAVGVRQAMGMEQGNLVR